MVTDVLVQVAQKYPNAHALSMKVGYRTLHFTYADVYRKAQQVALFLQDNGVGHDDKVLLMANNSPYWVIVYWGVLLNRSVIVPLTTQMMPPTVQRIAQQTEAKTLFKSRRIDITQEIVGPQCNIFDIEFLEELIAPFSPDKFQLPATADEAVVQIMYTSGTTGEPKGVMMTNRNLQTVLQDVGKIIKLKPQSDTLLSILPLSHIFEQLGMLLSFNLAAHTIYAHSQGALVQLMQQYRISKMIAVPEFLHIFMMRMKGDLEDRGFDKIFQRLEKMSHAAHNKIISRMLFYPLLKKLGGRLDTVVSAGAPLDPALEQEWEDIGIIVLQGYGMTEASPLITTNTFEERRLGSVGKPAASVTVKIADDGEILVKGPNIFKGYYKNEKLTAESFDQDGWFKTGDMGEFDEDGFLFLKGRKKYMIKGAGGQNVFPEDIEGILNNEPEVADSCVYGDEVAPGVTAIVAVLLLKKDGKASIDEIIERANNHLSSYQQITEWHEWPELDFPRSATRKIRKEEVKKLIAAQAENQEEAAIGTVSPLHRIIAQVTGMPVNRVQDKAFLVKDLKLDSLTRIELVSRIEGDLGKSIPETSITQKTTVADLMKMFQEAKAPSQRRVLARWPRSSIAYGIRALVQPLICLIPRPIIHLKISGLEHLEGLNEPVIFMPNHPSLLDSLFLLGALPAKFSRRLSFAAGEDVLYEDYRWAAPLADLFFNTFPLPRTEGGDVQFGLSNIGQLLDEGYSVAIFPEGRMSETGELQPLKDGAGLVATMMHAPVVPVKLKNVRALVGYNKLIPSTTGTVEVIFGKPLRFKMATTMQEAKEQIAKALQEL